MAFLPANHAHGHLRDVVKRMEAGGVAERYRMCNQIHDALVFKPLAEDAERCVAEAAAVMTAPSSVLKHPVLAPGGLWCGVEAQVGKRWNEMVAVGGTIEYKEAIHA